MPTVTVAEVVRADGVPIYSVLSDMAAFPRFMKNVQSVSVVERGEGFTHSQWVVKLQGATFKWTERDDFFPDEGRITYRQIEGDLKTFEGYWQLEPVSEGTRVILQTTFEFGMPMLASLLNPVAKLALRDNAKAMIRAIGDQVAKSF
ncbi:MAG: cyclase [Sulfobacillus benefaciens]|uniref:Cyclase n=1 Tax=Sulfobacillus benefaciens TaxID=453960 RepID=A0A2T2XB72_9FIRM|nr:MAG: cyclase [Sulfobacillus benefaciens]HBQ94925.1 cyclase [Sulfobacillus sp.]